MDNSEELVSTIEYLQTGSTILVKFGDLQVTQCTH